MRNHVGRARGAELAVGAAVMTMMIGALPVNDRPRERLVAKGAEALSDRELVALVLRSGTRGRSALDLAGELLADAGGVARLVAARPEELATKCGVGIAKAAALVAAFQLGARVRADEPRVVLRAACDVAEVAMRELAGLRRERVLVLICDAGNRLQRTVVVAEGAIDRSIVPVREILNAVLRHDGRAFAVAHNHPSGDPTPSGADREASRALAAAARVVGLRFLDHVVVAGDRWMSASATAARQTPG